MEYLKTIGLAAVATAALIGLAGTGTAPATVLCKEAIATGCAATGKDYPAGTVIKPSLEGSAIQKSGETTLATCTGGQFSSEVTSAGSSTTTVRGSNTTIDLENCVSAMHTLSLGTFELHHITGTNNGKLTASGVVIGWTIFGTNCLYKSGTGKDLGELESGASPTMSISITVLEAEPKKFICPDVTTWQSTFRFTSPNPLYVAVS